MFGFDVAASKTLNAVLSYMPKVPSWGYLGNARRYFDFTVYGGERGFATTEREFHHYGAPLNALVVMDAFRREPDDHYLLMVGMGGIAGSLTNINATDGIATMAWHGAVSKT